MGFLLRKRRKSASARALWVLLALLPAACGPVAVEHSSIDEANAIAASRMNREYRLSAGDELDIRFYYNPELNTLVIVRPDGRISVPLVEPVQALDLTPRELTERLRTAYARQLRRPEVTVIVRSFESQKVFVGGEVAIPGVLLVLGRRTLLQSVMQAGGFRETARLTEVLIVRRDPSKPNPIVIPVDVASILDGTDTRQDIDLLPFDIVYVPRSEIADVNAFIQEYIRANVPFGFGLAPGVSLGG